MTTMKSHLAILKELRRVERAIKKKPHPDTDGRALMGAQQALAWALGDNAMAPAKCFTPVHVSSEGGLTK